MEAEATNFELTIIVPCFNESPRVTGALSNISSACASLNLTNYEVLVVDDCSSDDTKEVVKNYIATLPSPHNFRLIIHEVNRGLGRTFVDTAFKGRGRYCRLVCGDDVESAETIATILSKLGEADIVVPLHPKNIQGKPLFRRILSKLYTKLVNLISGYNIAYYNGCPLLLRYDVMRWGPYSYGFGFQADLLTRLLDEGRTYIEVQVNAEHFEKDSGVSAIHLRNLLSVGHTLLELAIRRVRRSLYPPTPEMLAAARTGALFGED
ncbi:MAG: glycosyltransferase family 2 protein [Vulcanimicrobiota bacterium]